MCLYLSVSVMEQTNQIIRITFSLLSLCESHRFFFVFTLDFNDSTFPLIFQYFAIYCSSLFQSIIVVSETMGSLKLFSNKTLFTAKIATEICALGARARY